MRGISGHGRSVCERFRIHKVEEEEEKEDDASLEQRNEDEDKSE